MDVKRCVTFPAQGIGLRPLLVLVVSVLVSASWGCASRTLVITQENRVNTAVHLHRPVADRTGDPLEVTVVCVYPEDLELEANKGLRPGSGITSADWYAHRPQAGGAEAGRFVLNSDQIYLLTNEDRVYGASRGRALNGAEVDRTTERSISGIRFRGTKLRSRDSAIYVFPKFIGPDGKVLPVKPVMFHPPGAYGSRLTVKIGVDYARVPHGQYVERISRP